MKRRGAWLVLTLLVTCGVRAQSREAAGRPSQADPKYFHYYADVTAPAAQQEYVVVTPEVWRNATSDLRDLRLYVGATQAPYVLAPRTSEEASGVQRGAPVLNLGRVNGETQFVLDLRQGDEVTSFESVQLTLRDDTPDFIAKARVEGLNELEGTPVDLGASTVFKLEKEKLGANLTLKFPPSVFRYLRVTIPLLEPKVITGAHVFSPGAANEKWTEMDVPATMRNEGHDTVFEWEWPDTVPIGRIEFGMDPTTDFWRRVELRGEHESAVANGAIWSIKRRARTDQSNNFQLLVPAEAHSKHFKLIIHNGDDPPLPMKISAGYRERRMYFAPPQAGTLRLYFGDGELQAPVYDYARTWIRSANALPAELGAVQPNQEYTGRPDQRPWSERHPALLWIALGIAVLGLGAVAVKSLATANSDSEPGTEEIHK